MGKRAIRVELTEEEASTLKMWVNAGLTEQRLVGRARIIFLAAEGHPLWRISEEVGLSVNVCLKWRKRFMRDRLDNLMDRPRSGRPPTTESEQLARVVWLACERPFDLSVRIDCVGRSKGAVVGG